MSIDYYRAREIRQKLSEVADLLRQEGFNCEIEIRTSTPSGMPDTGIKYDAGYWKSSTAECEYFYGSSETFIHDDPPLSDRRWDSSANC